MAGHTCNPSAWEVEAEGRIQDQPQYKKPMQFTKWLVLFPMPQTVERRKGKGKPSEYLPGKFWVGFLFVCLTKGISLQNQPY